MLLLSLRRLHEIISISGIPIAVRHLYVEAFVLLASRMLPHIFKVHVHVGAPQIGLPYRRMITVQETLHGLFFDEVMKFPFSVQKVPTNISSSIQSIPYRRMITVQETLHGLFFDEVMKFPFSVQKVPTNISSSIQECSVLSIKFNCGFPSKYLNVIFNVAKYPNRGTGRSRQGQD